MSDEEAEAEPIPPSAEETLSIARERQQAANWLEGQDAIYSEVTCDT